MADVSNGWQLNDHLNVKKAWLGQMGKSHRRVRVYQFNGYELQGNTVNPSEAFRNATYKIRDDHVWLSAVKAFDQVRGGFFSTGDLDVNSEFPIQGNSPGLLLPDETSIPEYGGDLIQWNGQLFEVADVLEPVQFGFQALQIWYRTVLRKTNRAGIGVKVGP